MRFPGTQKEDITICAGHQAAGKTSKPEQENTDTGGDQGIDMLLMVQTSTVTCRHLKF
jgi:hypothetical protein